MRRYTRRERLWDTLASGLLILTPIILAYYILIGVQPASPLNPFAPPTAVALAYTPTAIRPRPTSNPTIAAAPTRPAATASPFISKTPTASPSATPTRVTSLMTPTLTLKPTRSPTVTPSPSPTRSPFTFTATINYQVHPVLTCDWTGVAGTVVDLKGRPARGYVVQVTGADRVNRQVTAGSSPDYGPGGWELRLGGQQAAGVWRVQLYAASDLKKPVSDAFEIVLPGTCQQNLAFVRFQQNH